jgi:hypothetical protein
MKLEKEKKRAGQLQHGDGHFLCSFEARMEHHRHAEACWHGRIASHRGRSPRNTPRNGFFTDTQVCGEVLIKRRARAGFKIRGVRPVDEMDPLERSISP